MGLAMVVSPLFLGFVWSVIMGKIQAIQFLRDNDESSNEWYEAGMWIAVKVVLSFPDDKQFTEEELQALLVKASKN